MRGFEDAPKREKSSTLWHGPTESLRASGDRGARCGCRHAVRLLVPPADPKALAGAILSLLNDHKRAERLGREARKDAQRMFDLKSTLNKIEMLYEKVLNSIVVKPPASLPPNSMMSLLPPN